VRLGHLSDVDGDECETPKPPSSSSCSPGATNPRSTPLAEVGEPLHSGVFALEVGVSSALGVLCVAEACLEEGEGSSPGATAAGVPSFEAAKEDVGDEEEEEEEEDEGTEIVIEVRTASDTAAGSGDGEIR
jgi:hypothetical protein